LLFFAFRTPSPSYINMIIIMISMYGHAMTDDN
jgi:hypothetical protein